MTKLKVEIKTITGLVLDTVIVQHDGVDLMNHMAVNKEQALAEYVRTVIDSNFLTEEEK